MAHITLNGTNGRYDVDYGIFFADEDEEKVIWFRELLANLIKSKGLPEPTFCMLGRTNDRADIDNIPRHIEYTAVKSRIVILFLTENFFEELGAESKAVLAAQSRLYNGVQREHENRRSGIVALSTIEDRRRSKKLLHDNLGFLQILNVKDISKIASLYEGENTTTDIPWATITRTDSFFEKLLDSLTMTATGPTSQATCNCGSPPDGSPLRGLPPGGLPPDGLPLGGLPSGSTVPSQAQASGSPTSVLPSGSLIPNQLGGGTQCQRQPQFYVVPEQEGVDMANSIGRQVPSVEYGHGALTRNGETRRRYAPEERCERASTAGMVNTPPDTLGPPGSPPIQPVVGFGINRPREAQMTFTPQGHRHGRTQIPANRNSNNQHGLGTLRFQASTDIQPDGETSGAEYNVSDSSVSSQTLPKTGDEGSPEASLTRGCPTDEPSEDEFDDLEFAQLVCL